MDPTALMSFFSVVFFTIGAAALIIRRNTKLLTNSIYFPLLISIVLYDVISLSNFLEHSNISSYFDPFEDLAEIIYTFVFLLFVNNWLKERSESTLRRSEALQKKMVAHIGDVIVIIDKDEINRYKSPNIEKLFGWKPDELVGTSTWDNIHPEDLSSIQAFFFDLLKTPNMAGKVECRYKRKDGEYRWIEFNAINLLDDEDIQGVLGNYHDITNRRLAEQSLRESEARFKALHNASFGGIAIHDKGVILECNQGLSDITGYPLEELIGMNGLLLISEKTRDMVIQNIISGYEKPYEAVGLKKNGEEYPIRLEARNIPYKGKMVRTVEFRDITENKQSEAEREKLQLQLIQAQKIESIGRLAGGVAHDFNNILGAIIGYAELGLAKLDESSPIYHNLEEILKAAIRSADITRQLLAFARQQTVVPKALDLNETIKSMLNMLRRLIGEDLELSWMPGVGVWPVKIDPSQIDQIMTNLCVNARDAIEDVGKITIQTQNITISNDSHEKWTELNPGDHVLLSVSDNGKGMSPEVLEKLFEPFFTTKDINKGTGLGLSTVYGIVKQNNGVIKVSSEPGIGTSFTIILPRHHGQNDPVTWESPSKAPNGNETILLVEDEPSILEMTREMLETYGYTVLPANSPADAIDIAQKKDKNIHLVITDVIMPDMNGKELVKSLLTLCPGIKHLFMSGYTADVISSRGILNDGLQFIQKPFSSSDLSIAVRKALEANTSSPDA